MGHQLTLPFEEHIGPGWVGKRYLLCSDGKWHLVLSVREGYIADTQCCEDLRLVEQDESKDQPLCDTCASLHLGNGLKNLRR